MQKVLKFVPTVDTRAIASFRRENSFWKELALIDLDTGSQIATVRFYGASSTSYCVAWIWKALNDESDTARGYGKAGGYGYHKASAAMHEALLRAGVKLQEPIDGRGDGVMTEALQALAEFLGVKRAYIHHAHA